MGWKCVTETITAWLKDKLETNKFALPALYQPASLIPLAIWKGTTLSTNSAEQQHRNIYRDGVNLTMLAGIIRGMQYDWRAIASIDIYRTTGIHHRDQPATYLFRITRSMKRHGKHSCVSQLATILMMISANVQRRVNEQAATTSQAPPSSQKNGAAKAGEFVWLRTTTLCKY